MGVRESVSITFNPWLSYACIICILNTLFFPIYTTYFRMDNEFTKSMIGVDIKAYKTLDFSTIFNWLIKIG